MMQGGGFPQQQPGGMWAAPGGAFPPMQATPGQFPPMNTGNFNISALQGSFGNFNINSVGGGGFVPKSKQGTSSDYPALGGGSDFKPNQKQA